VSRDGDRREAQFVIPCASGVSRALWPTCRRRYVATNWFAQQRRFFIMRGIGWSSVRRRVIRSLSLAYPLLIPVLLIAAIVLAVALFQYWVILFLFAVVWSVLIVIVTRFLCDKFYHAMRARYYKPRSLRSRALSALPQFPETPMPVTPLIRVLETIDLSTMDVEQLIANETSEQESAQIPIVQEKRSGTRDRL
jgi:hypothetical protein